MSSAEIYLQITESIMICEDKKYKKRPLLKTNRAWDQKEETG
jgi:hypothetical protein